MVSERFPTKTAQRSQHVMGKRRMVRETFCKGMRKAISTRSAACTSLT
jgi:hypothetical protein